MHSILCMDNNTEITPVSDSQEESTPKTVVVEEGAEGKLKPIPAFKALLDAHSLLHAVIDGSHFREGKLSTWDRNAIVRAHAMIEALYDAL